MTAFLGACGCCGGGPGDPGEPPPGGFPGGDPDPGWVTGYYLAIKRAQIARDGFPDLRTYYRSIPYDTGERFLSFEENTIWAGTESLRDVREFFNIAERLTPQGEFVSFDPYFQIGGQPYNPATCRNTKMFQGTTTPGWPPASSFYRLTGGHGGSADIIAFVSGLYSVQAIALVPVPESALDQIDGKLSVIQYRAGGIRLAAQRNPSTVTARPVLDGLRSGTRWECQAVPAVPDFYDAGSIQTISAGDVFHAFNLTDRARGATADNRLAWTGLKLSRTKQTVQVGFKSPMPTDPPVLKTYRKFTIPDGFSLLPGRQPAEAQQVFGMKMPANAEFVEEVELAIGVGQLIDFDPDDQEVYFFDGRPFIFPQPLPTADEVLTPLVTKARLWRVFQATYNRFSGELVTPLTVGTRWTHEDRCLKHEVSRSVNGGAEAVVGTIDHNPEERPTVGGGIPGWSGFNDPETGFSQFPLGWEWAYYDTDVAPGNTYTYRVRGYYDAARKSAYSAAYSVST
jgi:hypothetical protein